MRLNQPSSSIPLLIAVKRGDEITVEYSKNEIINKINSYFGYKLIGDIKLEKFNTEPKDVKNKNLIFNSKKNFEKKINEIKNKNLKNSLNQLLKAIK